MKLANLDTAVVNSNTLSNLEGPSPVCTVGAAVLALLLTASPDNAMLLYRKIFQILSLPDAA